MRVARSVVCCLVVVFALGIAPGIVKAEEFRIAILQEDQLSARKYELVVGHLAKTGIRVSLVEVPSYEAAAKMVAAGTVDAMFTGPGISGSMITLHELKQQRFFASFKKDDARAQRMIPSQTRLN